MNLVKVRVTRKIAEAEGICQFELVPIEGSLPSFTPGSHIDVHVRDGIIRQYSLCNDPAERHRYVIAVQREKQSRGVRATPSEFREAPAHAIEWEQLLEWLIDYLPHTQSGSEREKFLYELALNGLGSARARIRPGRQAR